MPDDAFRICATCRNLEILEQAREFPQIADTEYITFRCRRLNLTRREDYLMAPVSQDLPGTIPGQCPYWEPWQPEH